MGLAVLGVYGVVRYAVARRLREAAIRLSVGAEPSDLVRLLAGQGLLLVLIGDGIGLALGLVGSRVLGSFLFGISALDPVTFVAVPVVLALVGLLASYLPARRATRLDPSLLLRRE
jgi:putative ABC transport system permease protein